MRWLLAAAVLLAIGLGAFGVVPPQRAAACSLAPANLEQSAQYAEIIVVGEVVSERELHDAYESHESTIDVAAVLKGSAGSEITIAPTGWLGAACEGNPRLMKGERVLLFLRNFQGQDIAARPSPTPGPLQIAGYEGGKYVIDDGNVRSASANPSKFPAGGAIRRVAELAGTRQQDLNAALMFAAPHVFDTPEPPDIPRDTVCDRYLSSRDRADCLRGRSLESTSAWAVGPLIVVAVVLLGTIVLAGTMLARGRAR